MACSTHSFFRALQTIVVSIASQNIFDFVSSRSNIATLKIIDLEKDLESQGPFDVIIHKVTDLIPMEMENENIRNQIDRRKASCTAT
jgi:hypothetical protein